MHVTTYLADSRNVHLLMSGVVTPLLGEISDTMRSTTMYDSRTVMESDTFSPASTGSRKTKMDIREMVKAGTSKFIM